MERSAQAYSREAERLVERIAWRRGDVKADRDRLAEAIREQSRMISDFLIARSRRPARQPVR